jgi:hypothetical protein
MPPKRSKQQAPPPPLADFAADSTANASARLAQDGYVIFRGAVPESICTPMRKAIAREMIAKLDAGSPCQVCV